MAPTVGRKTHSRLSFRDLRATPDPDGAGSGGKDEAALASVLVSMNKPLREGVKTALTMQGVILGIVFGFNGTKVDLAIRVGAVSLALGVMVSLILMSLLGLPTGDPQRIKFVSVLLNLTYWALGYGLLCIAATLWFSG